MAKLARRVGLVACAVLLVPALTGMRAPNPRPHVPPLRPAKLLPMRQAKPVPVHPVLPHPVHQRRVPSWRPGPVRWPVARTATVSVGRGRRSDVSASTARLARPTPGSVRAGAMPLWIGPSGTGGPASVRVTMMPHRLAQLTDMTGAIFELSRADAGSLTANLHVTLGFAGFADAFGSDYGSRLRLVALPQCVLSTPRDPLCRVQTPVPSASNVLTDQVGGTVSLAPGTGRGSTMVLAVTTAPSGPEGDYSATPLPLAGTWTAGGSSGAFSYSYPIGVPPVPGGLQPDVSLGYSSQAVDGLTSSTNSQASWIGDGWGYSPGYIQRDYETCSQDNLTPALPSADKTGDLCWSANNYQTLSLNGQNTTLVFGGTTSGWHAMDDNGEQVSFIRGGTNGTHDGGYWKVTTPDGTSYYFGMNRLPGWTAGSTTTNSAWTLPVYGPRSGDPCNGATFAASSCSQAWRWNLDYVVDPYGNAIGYFYNTASNNYGADGATTGTASYIRSGALSQIWYGFRDGSVYNVSGNPAGAGEVKFTTAETRTDFPSDLACTSGGSCSVNSPTFWTKTQLTTIDAYALDGSSMDHVDSWALSQSFPAPDLNTTFPPLWLDSIQRKGEDGTEIKLPAVSFDPPQPLPNRVLTPADTMSGYPAISRERIKFVIGDTGSKTTVSYDNPPSTCTSGNFPSEDSNGSVCYPDWWTPPGHGAIEDWFNKYVVTQVQTADPTGGGQTQSTSYCYGTSPGCLNGGAWRYNDFTLTKNSQRTWDQWRGFQKVTTTSGISPDPITQVVDRYFQGMGGDHLSSGGTASVSLSTTVNGVTVTDPDSTQFAGMPFEHIVYDGQGGPVVSDVVTTPYTSASTSSQSQPNGLPNLLAYMTGTAKTQTFTALASGTAAYRESDVTYHHDSSGRVDYQADVPDTTDPTQDTCTQTTYATNATAGILDLPSEILVTSVPPASCPITGPPTQSQLVSDNLTFYDGATTLATDSATTGEVSMTQKATSFSGGQPAYTTESQATYDEYGRVLTSNDALNHVTTTTYTPATGAEPTTVSVKVTNALSLVTTTTYDPDRELALTVTDPAGYVTTKQYDSLGRLTAVYTPGHATSGTGAVADVAYSYSMVAGQVPVITEKKVTTSGGTNTTTTIYDSLGRPVETQSASIDGTTTGRTVTDNVYDSHGWKVLTAGPYFTSGAPSGTLVMANTGSVPSATGYAFDGAGRVTSNILYKFGTEDFETDTAYGGDFVTVTPPAGGTPKTTYTDGRGLTTYVYKYHSNPPPTAPPAPGGGNKSGTTGWNQTAYTYNPASELTGITDAAGNQWSFGYDLAGDQTSKTTPDAGTTTSTYNANKLLTSVTDNAGNIVSYSYDAANRMTGKFASAAGAQTQASQLDAWTYDSLGKGLPVSSTSYTNGSATGQPSYTEQVVAYDSFELPTGNQTVIGTGPLAGTYQQNLGYTPYGNLLNQYFDFGAGGLPSETVSLSYDTASRPTSLTSNWWTYVAALSYTGVGQPEQYAFGTTTTPAWLKRTYVQDTGQLDTQTVLDTTASQLIDTTSYIYDPSGNVTEENDTPASGAAQVQCFQYNPQDQLAQAWAQTAATCVASPSQGAEAGAAAGYWNSYTYDLANNLTKEVSTPPSGGATTFTNSFPGPVTGTTTTLPHAVGTQTSAAPGGTTTTHFGYSADGQTTSISGSGSQTLTWGGTDRDPAQLTSASTAGVATSYVYDASGKLLIQDDNGVPTLYLSDEEVTCTAVNTSGACTAENAVRYYSIGGVTIAVRTSAGQVEYLTGDQQSTETIAIDSTTLAVTRRWYDPNGNLLNQPTWPGNRGFVNGTVDPTTELENLGAREFNSGTSSFISPDAILDPFEPNDLNPYAYASDNPVTFSDPSGLCAGLPGEHINCNGQEVGPPTTTGSSTGSSNPYYPYGPYGPTDGGPGYSSCGLDGSCQPPVKSVTLRTIIAHKAAPVDYCAPNALHTGEGLGTCTFGQPPHREGKFGTFTAGLCGGLAYGFVAGGTVSDCILISHDAKTDRWQLGSTETGGFGWTFPTATIGPGITFSNAGSISQMGGLFGQVGGSADVGFASVGADYYDGDDSRGNLIQGGTISAGLGINAPFGVLGGEVHVFGTNTATQTWVSW